MFSEVNDFPILSSQNLLSKSPKSPYFTTISKFQIADRFAKQSLAEGQGPELRSASHVRLLGTKWMFRGTRNRHLGANKWTRTERSEKNNRLLQESETSELVERSLGSLLPYKGGAWGGIPPPHMSWTESTRRWTCSPTRSVVKDMCLLDYETLVTIEATCCRTLKRGRGRILPQTSTERETWRMKVSSEGDVRTTVLCARWSRLGGS